MNLFFAALLCGCVSLTTGETLTPVWQAVHYTTPYRVVGGFEEGETYYVCRAYNGGHRKCGKIKSSSGCIITCNDQCYTKSSYEMLVTPPYASFRYQWSYPYYRGGNVPWNAVACASDSYVGRRHVAFLFHGSYTFLGKIDTVRDALYYERSDGREDYTRTYRPLVMVPRTITEYRMINVVYDFDNSIVIQSEPKVGTTDTTVNNLDYAVHNWVRLEYSYKSTTSWADVKTYSMKVGTSLKVTAGKPLVSVEAAFEATRTSTHQQTTSREISEWNTVTKVLGVSMRGRETVEIILQIVEQRISVPYTADMLVVYTDGVGGWHSVEGNYIGFTSYDIGAEINPVGSDHVD